MRKVSFWKKLRIHGIVAAMTVMDCGCAETKHEAAASPAPSASTAAPAPLIQTKKAADWCREHGIPESVCTRCNKDLIAEFQKKGDWCASHGLPESQCIQCDPSREAKLKALEPKAQD